MAVNGYVPVPGTVNRIGILVAVVGRTLRKFLDEWA
ncbi:hypothetical protein F4559_003045 [Saccharothrix violaceirubra]|uniref:Uncharacterized protein n=1 Tax=Saccharothrix violaceirubra TaxID=413306 RepID=A0A7W7WW32_9PSEU|nr:hypothetical protein [Saccharothrix violaceirubra]